LSQRQHHFQEIADRLNERRPNYPPILALNGALSTAKLFVHGAAYTIDRHFLTILHDVAARIPTRLLLGKA
jgi:hypothetical protein